MKNLRLWIQYNMAKYKQVKILQEYADMLEAKGLSANQAIAEFLGINKTVDIKISKPLDLGLPNQGDLGLPKPNNKEPSFPMETISKPIQAPQALSPILDSDLEEQLKYLTLCVSGMHNFLWKTQTVNGYQNPSSYKINLMAKRIYAELKEESENL